MSQTQIEPFFLNSTYLMQIADSYRQEYVSSVPFPHVAIDNFLPPEVLEEILEEFPQPNQSSWTKFEDANQIKLASNAEQGLGVSTRLLLQQFNSSVFISFLESLTGISGLIPDPHFMGGGLHQIVRGGFLNIHIDFNHNLQLHLDRRINVLLYLNKNWKEEYGGHLELWNQDMTQCAKSILPIFNRCVIFNTSEFSYHGHPNPLTCPSGWSRKSIAMYYYTNGRPVDEVAAIPHTTEFRDRPHEKIVIDPKLLLRKLVPPILFDLKRYIQRY